MYDHTHVPSLTQARRLTGVLTATFLLFASGVASAKDNLLHTYKNHKSGIISVSFAQSGTLAVSTSTDSTARIWDLVEQKNTIIAKNPYGRVSAAEFAPDELTFASAGRDGKVRIWDVETGELLQKLTYHYGEVLSLAYSPDGQRLASGSLDRTVIIWNLDKGAAEMIIKSPTDSVFSVDFSESGQLLTIGTGDGNISVWDLEEKKRLFSKRIVSRPVVKVGFYDGDKNVMAAYLSGHLVNLNAKTGVINKRFGQPGRVITSADFHDAHDAVVVGTDKNGVIFHSISSDHVVHAFPKVRFVNAVALSSDARLVLTGDASGRMSLWDSNNASLTYKNRILRDLQYALSVDTVEAISDFIKIHENRCLLPSDCARVDRAINELWKRIASGSSSSIGEALGFIERFKDSESVQDAIDFIYETVDTSGNLAAYLWFARTFPDHDHAADAFNNASEIGYDLALAAGTTDALFSYVMGNPFSLNSNDALDKWESVQEQTSKEAITSGDLRARKKQARKLLGLIVDAQKRGNAVFDPMVTGRYLLASRGYDVLKTHHVNDPLTIQYQGSDWQLAFEQGLIRAQSYLKEITNNLAKANSKANVQTLSDLNSDTIEAFILKSSADETLRRAYLAEFSEWKDLLERTGL